MKKYLPVLKAFASLSKDKSRGIAAMCLGNGGEIVAQGWNGFPRKVREDIDARHQKPEKYKWTSHAEENCIVNAARSGARLEGTTMLLYGLMPCSTCARMIVQAGIVELHCFLEGVPNIRWVEDQPFSKAILEEGGVKTFVYPDQEIES